MHLKSDKKIIKDDKKEVISIKNKVKKWKDSPSLLKKSRPVKDLIGSFEAVNVTRIDKTINKNEVSEGDKKDAFEVLMGGKLGDTLIKKHQLERDQNVWKRSPVQVKVLWIIGW